MKYTTPRLIACPLAAALIAAALCLPTWAQEATPQQTTQEAPANNGNGGLGGLYEDPDPRDEEQPEDQEDPLPQDLAQLALSQEIPLQANRRSQFNFRAQKPGMMTLLVAGLGNIPSIHIETRNGVGLPNGELNAGMVNQLQRQNNFSGQLQDFTGYGEASYGLAGNNTTAWLLVHIPQAGDYTVTFNAQSPDVPLNQQQPQRRWAIPVDELQQNPQENEDAQDAAPTPFARAEFVELVDAQDIQAEQQLAVQREAQAQQVRQQQLQQQIQNAPTLVSGQAVNAASNTWVQFTAPEGGFLIVTGLVNNGDLRFQIHAPTDLESYLEYIDEDRDRNAGSEAILYPLSANETILINVICRNGRNSPVRLRTHFEPN